ncbi:MULTISPECIES: XRE family transcriptional regulator [unclassified Bifidobacterium]|uniref:XRE family transcriptional regulator n=1 Tax=unclassified Bifidobacterium TaxID=2608897 RepID=UPI0023F6861B|nr:MULTISPECIES: XRE family transcriptional regulator [unclassified Bifidobacterium]WEV65323.1 XRE family transcriptional regulator [Bifidobacterium sp. ESL0764]WEV75873.1 XRE family transcriptional regulator [Bifidobacterium sp. ESL0800]
MVNSEVTAIATRSGKWWAIEVPQRPGLFTQVKRLDQVDAMVHDAAKSLGKPVGAVHLEIRLGDAQDDEMISELREARDEAAKAQERASTLTRHTIASLRKRGFKLADIARIIGLTIQRVSALQYS